MSLCLYLPVWIHECEVILEVTHEHEPAPVLPRTQGELVVEVIAVERLEGQGSQGISVETPNKHMIDPIAFFV